jgi:hypothetical protein
MDDKKEDKVEQERARVRNQVKTMCDATDWITLAELYNNRARHTKMKYDALIKQGFNETQALYLSEKWV